ncbi:MAG TPA: hypothetical protein VE591_01940, partial [Candidatus Acidoferrum sp.]|nr:hypothetical protein [Candidatus Acidoferrum sp.]
IGSAASYEKAMRLIRLFTTSRRSLVRLPGLLLSDAVPLRYKLLVVGLALLIISPLNIFGDIPFFGIVDDVVLFGLLLDWFVRNAERSIATATIDGSDLVVPR